MATSKRRQAADVPAGTLGTWGQQDGTWIRTPEHDRPDDPERPEAWQMAEPCDDACGHPMHAFKLSAAVTSNGSRPGS